MHLATTEAIRRATQGQALALAVSYSLKNYKNSSLLTPQNLGLWKSIVLPHLFQNLQYIQSETDMKTMQNSLNLSLARVLHVYCHGNQTGLLADTGIPHLHLTQYVHFAQLHFRLSTTWQDTLPAFLFKDTLTSPQRTTHNSRLPHPVRKPCIQHRRTLLPSSSHGFTTSQKP